MNLLVAFPIAAVLVTIIYIPCNAGPLAESKATTNAVAKPLFLGVIVPLGLSLFAIGGTIYGLVKGNLTRFRQELAKVVTTRSLMFAQYISYRHAKIMNLLVALPIAAVVVTILYIPCKAGPLAESKATTNAVAKPVFLGVILPLGLTLIAIGSTIYGFAKGNLARFRQELAK